MLCRFRHVLYHVEFRERGSDASAQQRIFLADE